MFCLAARPNKLQVIYKCPRHPECTVSNFVELTDFWIQFFKYNEHEPASNMIAIFFFVVCVFFVLFCFLKVLLLFYLALLCLTITELSLHEQV